MGRPASNTPNPRLLEARGHVEQGRLKKARTCFKEALRQDGRNPVIVAELGTVEALCGNIATGRKLIQRAIGLAPRHAAFHFNLGELERQQGRYPEAERSFRAALTCDPDDPDATFGLGVCRLMLDDPSGAIRHLVAAHALSPNDPEVLPVLAKAYQQAGRIDDAVTVFRQVVARDPDNGSAWFDLAAALDGLRRYPEASEAYRTAHSKRPIPVERRWKWALTEIRCARYQQALDLLADAIHERSDVSETWFAKAVANQYLGDFDEAERNLRQALEINPDFTEAYQRLMQMSPLATADADRLETVLWGKHTQPDASRAAAGYTLYRHYDARNELQAAFHALSEANRLQLRHCTYTVAEHEAFVARAKSVFTPDFFRERTGQGSTSEVPVFILGMPRSGTTLVEQILGFFPEVSAGEEMLIVPAMTARMENYPDCVVALPPHWAASAAESVLDEMERRAGTNVHITDKTPANYFNIGLISWMFPRSKIIYCGRDPRDIGFSCFEQNFGHNLDFACDLDAFVRAYEIHLDIMDHWNGVLPSRIFHLGYEELVASPQEVARQLTGFCGLAWDEDCVDTSKHSRPVQTASYWQVRQPITTKSIGRWHRYAEFLGDFPEKLDRLGRSRASRPAQ